MELSELAAYAGEKYQIHEQHKWADFPGFSVLCHPQTGKWIALLMRAWDGDTGEVIERCDMKCGRDCLARFQQPYLTQPISMQGDQWICIAFDNRTESEIVHHLLDQAVALGRPQGYTVVLASQFPSFASDYRETALPFAGSTYQPPREKIPERLREMRRLYEYGRESVESRAKNFYRQAAFMQDYEDDVPWQGHFVRYFPTYHDLTNQQLRGYFTWRARLRRGDVQPIAASAAYIYIYELLNGVGASSPEDGLQKLHEFESGYFGAGYGDVRMRANLRRWMLEYAVLCDLPPELARQAADPEMLERDEALSVLRKPQEQTEEEVFASLCCFGGKKVESSPVLAADPRRGKRLFAGAWRVALAYREQDKDLFTLCFGKRKISPWYPLSNAVYYEHEKHKDRTYVLSECRSYRCQRGVWQVDAYEKLSFDRARLQGFLHETDALLRRYLKTGRYLREKAANAWADPYIQAAIEEDKQALLEAARPKVTIDLTSLDKIRSDAVSTRDSLLTQDEWEEEKEAQPASPPAASDEALDIPLDREQIEILRALLAGRDVQTLLRQKRLMPSIVADAVNEAFFDRIGDTVLLCEGEALALVEDYIVDIERILGGNSHG